MKINSGTIGAITILAGLAIVWVIYWLVMQQEKQKASAGAGMAGTGATGIGAGLPSGIQSVASGYIVRAGDTLNNIALKYNTTVAAIIAKNGFVANLTYPTATALLVKNTTNPNLIYVGQSLKV